MDRKSINKILFAIVLILIIILVIVIKLSDWKENVKASETIDMKTVAKNYVTNLFEKDYEEIAKMLNYDGVVTYISMYNNWSYNIADDWDEIYSLSQTSGIIEDLKNEVEDTFEKVLLKKEYTIEDVKLEIEKDIEVIEEAQDLYKVTVKVTDLKKNTSYDDEVYLLQEDGNIKVVASNFIEEISDYCFNTLITTEYSLKKSLDEAIVKIARDELPLTKANINDNLYDFKICKDNSIEVDDNVFIENTVLADGDKIYLVDLYEADGIYYEVTLADIDGILCVGEIIELKS